MGAISSPLIGEDDFVSSDQLPLTPLSGTDQPLDPLQTSIVDPQSSSTFYGPTLAQGGIDPNSQAVIGNPPVNDPSATNAHPSTAAASGTSVLDDILKLGQIGVGVATALQTKTANNANAPAASKTVATAKTGTTTGSTSILILVVVIFVALVAWFEVKH